MSKKSLFAALALLSGLTAGFCNLLAAEKSEPKLLLTAEGVALEQQYAATLAGLHAEIARSLPNIEQ